MKVLNPTFINQLKYANRYIFEFRTIIWCNLVGDFKGILSRMLIKQLNGDIKEEDPNFTQTKNNFREFLD